ncbi:MAG: biotin-independent malonate decarboxylase subunit gamma [Nevskia sp.]|nr:biotin-independent malonate decarboxylase subunit gamma [Nevskia sp.]
MSTQTEVSARGITWLRALTAQDGVIQGAPATVRVAEAALGDEPASFIAVVPDPHNRFPRARNGEVGLEEGWTLARQVRKIIAAGKDGVRRPIIALVDVSSQAYGRREELLGVHLACAAAADAYASARLAGHPVIALLVGKAMSGAFLAHGYQANRLLALDSPEVMVHAMGKQAAARVTRRSVADLEKLGERIAPMAYDIRAYAKLGLLHQLIEGVDADAPGAADVQRVREALLAAIADTRAGPSDLSSRLSSPAAHATRAASIEVRRRLAEQWDVA